MLNKVICDWLSQYEEGTISSSELVGLIFSRLTSIAKEINPVLVALQRHSDPYVQDIAVRVAELLKQQERKGSSKSNRP
jgi:hypothetical protein